MAESSDDLAKRFLTPSGTPDVRVQRCMDAIRQALEEHGCELQVWGPVGGNGQQAFEIKVMPVNRVNDK